MPSAYMLKVITCNKLRRTKWRRTQSCQMFEAECELVRFCFVLFSVSVIWHNTQTEELKFVRNRMSCSHSL